MGCSDTNSNNCDPNYRGKVIVNDVELDVVAASVFNGMLHYGINRFEPNNSIVGWVPACLCEIK